MFNLSDSQIDNILLILKYQVLIDHISIIGYVKYVIGKTVELSNKKIIVLAGLVIVCVIVFTLAQGAHRSGQSTIESNISASEEVYRKPTAPQPTHTSSITPSLQFNVTGAEILVTDELDRQTGYNPVFAEIVISIPVSDYWNAEIIPYGAGPSGTIQRALSIDENADGRYRLQVFGATTGIQAADAQVASEFEVTVVGFDENYQDWETTISGSILPGKSVEYQVIYEPENETLLVRN